MHVRILKHFPLFFLILEISQVEIEWLLCLLCDLETLLFDAHSSLLIRIHDGLITGNKNCSWNRLMSELMLNHVFLFNLFFLGKLECDPLPRTGGGGDRFEKIVFSTPS